MQPNVDDIFICMDINCDAEPKVTTNQQDMRKHKKHSDQLSLKEIQSLIQDKDNNKIVLEFLKNNNIDVHLIRINTLQDQILSDFTRDLEKFVEVIRM